ncbi:MAG: ProQ/FinO family protein [Gammaproteobacteria bacterium]|nr:ProQ/FinO family protein [Gammaproteobacteria bacterium]
MSNASIKEQLQALSLGLTSVSDEKEKKSSEKKHSHSKNPPTASPKAKPNIPSKQKTTKQKPAWLEHAQYGVELLKAHFPLCFKNIKEVQPLKIGIKQDLVKLLSTKENIVTSDKACMVSSIAYYVNSPAYHKSMLEGTERIDLDGNTAGVVTAEEANYSIESRKIKSQAKKPTPTPAKALETGTIKD